MLPRASRNFAKSAGHSFAASFGVNDVFGLFGIIVGSIVTFFLASLMPPPPSVETAGRGYGAALVAALECEVAKRGRVMIYLGSDDECGTTSLFGVDLYEDTLGKIANIKNTGGHPYSFYEKQGYKIVGVFPTQTE